MPDRAGRDDLVGTIYEAGAFPDRWQSALDEIAGWIGAKGGNLIRSTAQEITMISSPGIEEPTREFIELGYNRQNTRVSRLLEKGAYPGFLTDSDLHTEHELATSAVYAEFLNPRGLAAGAGTLIQGARDDAIILALEAFESHVASRQAVPALDALRPHLARAAVLSSQIQAARAQSIVEAFDAVGSAIALLDFTGRAVAASARFIAETAELISDGPMRLRMHDPQADERFAEAIGEIHRHRKGSSIALRNGKPGAATALHLVPAHHDARELFSRVTIFAILAPSGNAVLPSADIIGALFDLTPAEARVARGIAAGMTAAELAGKFKLSPQTIRTHLKHVFAKTSTRRQSELCSLILKLR